MHPDNQSFERDLIAVRILFEFPAEVTSAIHAIIIRWKSDLTDLRFFAAPQRRLVCAIHLLREAG